MPVVWVKFSAEIDFRNFTTGYLSSCPVCGGARLQRWGKIEQVRLNNGNMVRISRFRCFDCGHTYSDPVKTNVRQSYLDTIQAIAGMIWFLGFSLREVEALFQRLDLEVSRSSIWRYGKSMAKRLDCGDRKDQRFEIDALYIPGVSEKLGVIVGLELSDGRQVVLGALPECNPIVVKGYLEDLLSDAEVEIVISGGKAIQAPGFVQENCPLVIG
jgi:hypothetical protein